MWWRTVGTHSGPYGDIAPMPTGKRITMEGVDFFTVAGDRIVGLRSVWGRSGGLSPVRADRRRAVSCAQVLTLSARDRAGPGQAMTRTADTPSCSPPTGPKPVGR